MSETGSLRTPIEWWEPYVNDCGVEEPSQLAQVLAETIPIEEPARRLLDIGCGSGIIGLYCLMEKKAHSVTFSDIMPQWVDLTRVNTRLRIHDRAISSSQVDVLDAVAFDQIAPEVIAQHDMVVFNLPQFPEAFVSEEILSKLKADPVNARYRLAGPDGLKFARDFCLWFSQLKRPRPEAVFVLWSILGKRQIIEAINAGHCGWSILKETPIPLKPAFSSIAAQFFQDDEERENRMLRKDGDGWKHNVLTIRLTNN